MEYSKVSAGGLLAKKGHKKYLTWGLIVAIVLVFGYAQLGWFGGYGATTETDTSWLMVLHAGEAEITEARGETFITLSKISRNTVFFSDRPERSYQSIDTHDFLAGWDTTFADSPPNAAVVHSEAGVDAEVVIIELFSPIITADEISFPIAILGGEYTKGEIYTDVNLFIDGAKLFEWNSCTGQLTKPDGFDRRICWEQWGSYSISCGDLKGRQNSAGHKCKSASPCQNAYYSSSESWHLSIATYFCDE